MRLHASLTCIITVAAVVGCGGPVSTEEQSPGEAAFRASCQTCHTLPRPSMRSDDEWPALVDRYGERANLDAETRAIILAYLQRSN
ncbi:MAG: cytochrome c [candidate division Zixibacteria bacterium]|nr:cytochrome c [candidate division Zixibacteria bacterium]